MCSHPRPHPSTPVLAPLPMSPIPHAPNSTPDLPHRPAPPHLAWCSSVTGDSTLQLLRPRGRAVPGAPLFSRRPHPSGNPGDPTLNFCQTPPFPRLPPAPEGASPWTVPSPPAGLQGTADIPILSTPLLRTSRAPSCPAAGPRGPPSCPHSSSPPHAPPQTSAL